MTSLSAGTATVQDSSGTTVGSGSVALAGAAVAATVGGSVDYAVDGSGQFSFFGPATTDFGASADWSQYVANLSGNVSITLSTGQLSLNGTVLPAGTYTINTSAAQLEGAGKSTSPDFATSADVTVTGGTVVQGSATGAMFLAATLSIRPTV